MNKAAVACVGLGWLAGGVLGQTQVEPDAEWRSRPPRECSITEPPFADRSLWNANTWPGGIVHFSFAANATRDYRIEMRRAMDEIEYVCNVTFLPRSTEANYIVIQDATVNNSQVGMVGGAQTINIFNWNSRYTMVHELMHALGVWHEQSRADRGSYVQINAQNIQPGAAHNFDVVPTAAPEGPFDFESVMLYDGCAFSNCCPTGSCACAIGCATIEALPPYTAFQSAMGQRNRLSEGDKAGLVSRYGVSTAWTRAVTAAINPANNKVYVLGGRSTWTLAQRRAVDLGGSLATVRSQAENQFIYSTFSAFGGVNRNLWIGSHDTDQSSNSTDRATRRGEFGWVSGETSTYSRWSGVEPNNPSVNEPSGNWEFYVHIWQPADPNASTWNNLSDSNTVFNAPVCGVVETCVFAPASPVAASVCPSASAQFTVNAVGAGTLSYQWQHNGLNIASGDPAYTGANGPSLVVVQATAAELGAYRCWVSNSCGGVWSSTCVLKHEEPSACTACDPIDFNGDGLFPDTQDIADFLTVFGGGACPTGTCGDIDFNNDGLFPDVVSERPVPHRPLVPAAALGIAQGPFQFVHAGRQVVQFNALPAELQQGRCGADPRCRADRLVRHDLAQCVDGQGRVPLGHGDGLGERHTAGVAVGPGEVLVRQPTVQGPLVHVGGDGGPCHGGLVEQRDDRRLLLGCDALGAVPQVHVSGPPRSASRTAPK